MLKKNYDELKELHARLISIYNHEGHRQAYYSGDCQRLLQLSTKFSKVL